MITREAKESVKEINETFRVLLVTGPRQVGKTTLLKNNMSKNMNYITLDDESLKELAKSNPKQFIEEHPYPLFIDEVQYAPELFSYIKMVVDEKNERGMYWLTGSQQFNLMKNVSESLAGRVGIIKMNTLTYAEIIGNENKMYFDMDNIKKADYINVNELFDYIFKGGMPELYDHTEINRRRFFDSYIDTYITRDVTGILEVRNKELFKKFLISMACRNGELLNYSNISSELGINDKTVKEWVNILVTSGIIYLLEPFRSNKLDRITHMHKIIFMDSGLCAYLAGWIDARSLQLSSVAGHYLETYIISDIIKTYNALGLQLNISYYRDKDKNEIDLIMEQNNKIYPFEIKKTSTPKANMIETFKKLDKLEKEIAPGGIICCYDHLMHLDEKNYIIPISSVINASKSE